MSTLALVYDHTATTTSTVLAFAATDGQTIATTIRNFIGPIVLLAIGLFALKFLAQRQITQFFQFAGLALLVGVFFYTPNAIESVATWVGSLFGGTKAT